MPNENDDEEEGDEAVVAIVAVVCRNHFYKIFNFEHTRRRMIRCYCCWLVCFSFALAIPYLIDAWSEIWENGKNKRWKQISYTAHTK